MSYWHWYNTVVWLFCCGNLAQIYMDVHPAQSVPSPSMRKHFTFQNDSWAVLV